MSTPVVLLIADDFIRPALYKLLSGWREFALRIDDPEPGNVVVTTPRDCSLELCAELASQGCSVVVLTPVWRALSRKQYLQAGAFDYIAMELDSRQLAQVICDAGAANRFAPRLAPNVAIG